MKDLMKLKNTMRLAVALIVLLVAGCSSGGKDASKILIDNCNGEITMSVTVTAWGSAVTATCAGMSAERKGN